MLVKQASIELSESVPLKSQSVIFTDICIDLVDSTDATGKKQASFLSPEEIFDGRKQ